MKSKLNLGSGEDYRQDCLNVDIREDLLCDEIVDVFGKLPWPDGAFEEILAFDILEHTSWFHTGRVLEEWIRVLATGGLLRIRVPDLERICWMVVENELDVDTASALIYGAQNQGDETWRTNAHAAGFSKSRIRNLFATLPVELLDLYQSDLTNLVVLVKKVDR